MLSGRMGASRLLFVGIAFLIMVQNVSDAMSWPVGSGNLRRRALRDSNEDLSSLLTGKCHEAKYVIYLQMPDIHLSLLAIRRDVQENEDDDCVDVLMMHDAGEGVGKELLISDWIDIGPDASRENESEESFESGMLLIGEFELKDILQAWQRAQVPEAYDPMWDNCMMVLLDVLYDLHYTPERDIVNYVTAMIVRDSDRVVELLDERRDRSKNTEYWLSWFDFSYVAGSGYLVELYCWQFITRHKNIWEARDKIPHQLLFEETGRRLQASCSLCYGGASPSPPDTEALAYVPRFGYSSCDQATTRAAELNEGDPECTTAQVSGYAHCGCPFLPPKNDNFACQFCENGEFGDIDLNKEVFEAPNLASIRESGANTCFDVLVTQHFQPFFNVKCEINHRMRYYCGCPDALPPDPCLLCEDPLQSLPVPDKVILPGGVTCQDVQELVDVGLFENRNCPSVQATAGIYCGCDNPVAAESACYICDFGTRATPNPEYAYVSNVVVSPDSPPFEFAYSCGQIEYENMEYTNCELGFLYSDFCGCKKPVNPCAPCNVSQICT